MQLHISQNSVQLSQYMGREYLSLFTEKNCYLPTSFTVVELIDSANPLTALGYCTNP